MVDPDSDSDPLVDPAVVGAAPDPVVTTVTDPVVDPCSDPVVDPFSVSDSDPDPGVVGEAGGGVGEDSDSLLATEEPASVEVVAAEKI